MVADSEWALLRVSSPCMLYDTFSQLHWHACVYTSINHLGLEQ
jgi:hypothetical protein